MWNSVWLMMKSTVIKVGNTRRQQVKEGKEGGRMMGRKGGQGEGRKGGRDGGREGWCARSTSRPLKTRAESE